MKYINKFNEEIGFKQQAEYLLVLHFESGDEIHFHVLDFSHWVHIEPMVGDYNRAEEMVNYILQHQIESKMYQTNCLEDSFLGKYYIKKIINIPELGN